MSALDGKITIERELRPCIVRIPDKKKQFKEMKALFHCWDFRSEVIGESYLRGGHPAGQIAATFAIVEYEDGTIHEVEPTQIRFVDNAMSEYVFQEDKGEKEKAFDVLRGICPECGGNMRIDEGIVLTSNPPQYRLKCDKCGHIEYSGIRHSVSDNYE